MRFTIAHTLIPLTLALAAGCQQNPYTAGQQQQLFQQQQQQQFAMEQRFQELQTRAATLDQDNRELQSLVAQLRQQSQLAEDKLLALRDQLTSATAQIGKLHDEKQITEKQAEALVASTRRRAGATITANSSLRRDLPAIALPGVNVRPDGDVVRIELPAARLFGPYSTTLAPTAGTLLETVASEILRTYPDHKIGIEGHTDNTILRGTQGGTNQQFASQRATAVYQHLTTRTQLKPSQLFTVAHGANHPVVSNATPAGRERNNRVEIVIYPERLGERG
jgi:flagellar motor protein MotB